MNGRIDVLFTKISQAISRTTGLNIDLFVLISMHLWWYLLVWTTNLKLYFNLVISVTHDFVFSFLGNRNNNYMKVFKECMMKILCNLIKWKCYYELKDVHNFGRVKFSQFFYFKIFNLILTVYKVYMVGL